MLRISTAYGSTYLNPVALVSVQVNASPNLNGNKVVVWMCGEKEAREFRGDESGIEELLNYMDAKAAQFRRTVLRDELGMEL